MRAEIFREYDIRGLVDRDLTPDVVRKIGRATGTYLAGETGNLIALGRDVRPSSPGIAAALTEGLRSTGARVLDVGVVPTPALYFAIGELQADGGVMVTGSHNPPEFNGLKVCRGQATLYGPAIQELRRLAEAGEFRPGIGSRETSDIIPRYQARLKEGIHITRPLTIVVDAGNGTAGPVVPPVMESLGCRVVKLYCEPDGTFPFHHPDPTIPANLVALQNRVREEGADLGVAYDGDADRIGVVDEKGKIIWGDRLLALYARDILRQGAAKIVLEVKCSQALVDDIRARGGTPIMWKAGHSLIKQKMKEEAAPLGGEMSGHMFFADRYYGFDDALYASLRLLEILSREGRPLSSLLADLPEYPSTPELRLGCPDDQKFEVVAALVRRFSAKYPIIDVDGVRVLFSDGWALVRASNTQPALVVRLEAHTSDRLAAIRQIVTSELARFPSVEPLPGDQPAGHR